MEIKRILILLMLLISIKIYGANSFIKNIYFHGLQHFSKISMMDILPIAIGDKVSKLELNNTVRTLFRTGYFEKIQLICNNNIITIKVKERPIIVDINFSGNKSITKDEVNKILESNNIIIGSSLNKSNIYIVEKIIEDFYLSIGKYNAKIKFILNNISCNKVTFKLVFDEGNFSKIKKINIVGNDQFTTEQLISKFELKDYVPWWDIVNNRKYQKQKLMKDLDNLKVFYLNNGYVRYVNNLVQISLSNNKKDLYIFFHIYEGEKYKISKFNITSNMKKNYLLPIIKKKSKLKLGNTYNFEKIQLIENNIKKIIGIYGYVFPLINTDNNINDIKKTIDVNININLGNRYNIRKINFQGNKLSKDIVLRREVLQMESSWLNTNLVEIGNRHLNNTGYFEEVNYNFEKISDQSNQLDLIYTVKEKNTGNFSFGVGYGVSSGITFQGSIQKDNVLGSGNNIILNATKNENKINSELFFINPNVNNGINFGNRIFYDSFKSNKLNLAKYTQKSYGIDNFVGLPLGENSTLRIGLGYYYNYLFDIKPQVSILRYLNFFKQNKKINYFATNDVAFNYGITYNSLDKTIFPIKGQKLNFDGKITIPGSDNNFYKFTFDTQKYIPLNKSKSIIFYLHSRLGYGDGFNKKELSFYENFYANGFSAIRGFLSNSIGPKAIYYGQSSNCLDNDYQNNKNIVINKNNVCISNDAIGGNAIAMASLEFIIPVVDIKHSNNFRTSIFFDVGSVWDTRWERTKATDKAGIPNYKNFKNFRSSVGISMQWISPLGPLELSYAIPLKKYKEDQVEKLQFVFGKNW